MLVLFAGLVVFTSCKDDDPQTDPPVVILDGIYVKGGATAFDGFDAKAMMAVTKNEVNQTERASLYELYIPLKAGADGFNIVKVAGSEQMTYGPGANWGIVAAPTTDEPKDVSFLRGTVEENATKFTVDADGIPTTSFTNALFWNRRIAPI